MKLGLVLIPAMPTLGQADIADRLERGQAKYLVAHGADAEKFARLGGRRRARRGRRGPARLALLRRDSWRRTLSSLRPDQGRRPDAALFTSGTTARAKLVVHTHSSYPIGHLSTMYGLGSNPATPISTFPPPAGPSTAWSSVFAPWNAGAT